MKTMTHKPIDPRRLKARAFGSFAKENKSWQNIARSLKNCPFKMAESCLVCGSRKKAETVCEPRGFEFVQCPDCSHVYQKKQLDEKAVIDFFTQDTFMNLHVDEEQFAYRKIINQDRVKLIADHAPKEGNWLDMACGAGDLLACAAELGYSPWGFDVNSPGCEMAEKLGVKVMEGDQSCFYHNHPEMKFSVITMIGYLDLLPRPAKNLREAADSLTENGVIAISQPCFDSITGQSVLLFPNTSLRCMNPLDRSFYTRRSLKKLLEQCGLKPVLTWDFGLDFYDFMSQLCLQLPQLEKSPVMAFFMEHFNDFQKIIDKENMCDEIFIIAQKTK